MHFSFLNRSGNQTMKWAHHRHNLLLMIQLLPQIWIVSTAHTDIITTTYSNILGARKSLSPKALPGHTTASMGFRGKSNRTICMRTSSSSCLSSSYYLLTLRNISPPATVGKLISTGEVYCIISDGTTPFCRNR